MKITGRISRRYRIIFVTLPLVAVAVVAGVLLAGGVNEAETERRLFLISFHESIDPAWVEEYGGALVEEYGGEIWIRYSVASRINARMTPAAAEALAEHEAVECVDQRQLFIIRFEESVDLALVEEYGGEVYGQLSMLPAAAAFMTPEAAEALAEHPAVRHVEPDWPGELAEDEGHRNFTGSRA